MTQTLTTERLKQITDAISAEPHDYESIYDSIKHGEIAAMAGELLANREAKLGNTEARQIINRLRSDDPDFDDCSSAADFIEKMIVREAQPVAWRHDDGPITQYKSVADKWMSNGWTVTSLYTAPPAPAATTPISFSENADADMCREWAWKQVKEQLTPDGWTVGDNITYFGFFCWGWDMRRQYNEQRPPASVVNPEFTGAPAVTGELLEAMDEVIRISDRDHVAWVRAKSAISNCRAAMLAQPVSQGYRLVPVEPTQAMRDAWFFMEDFDTEWKAMLAAAPEGGNGA
ncbi:hypothetical protein [Serratia inhibens]